MPDIGLQFPARAPAREIATFAADAQARGFASAWVVEDCFLSGSVALAAVALQATTRLRVGIGLMPAVVRNPAIAAMEIATLGLMFPGRLSVAFGHGVEAWMAQIGARPADRVVALEETVAAVRRLLSGETVTMHRRHVHLDAVALESPPAIRPPILVGTTGAKTLAAAHRCADGLLLPEGCGPAFLRSVVDGLPTGLPRGRLVAYSWLSLHESSAADAVARLHPIVARWREGGLYPAPLRAALEASGGGDALVREVAVCGTADECEHAIRALESAGADEVVLSVASSDDDDQIARFADRVLPRLRSQ